MEKVPEKARNLILYLANEMERENHAGRGRIKLSKLLWRCDFGAYWRLGEPITELTYVADTLGPKPKNEKPLINEMVEEGIFTFDEGFDQQKLPRALAEADLSMFSAPELLLVDEQLERYKGVTARQMTDEAHEFSGWKHAFSEDHYDQDLPYESVHWEDREQLDEWEQTHAAALA